MTVETAVWPDFVPHLVNLIVYRSVMIIDRELALCKIVPFGALAVLCARLLPGDVVMNTPVRVTTAAELGNALRSHRKKRAIRQQELADDALLSPKFLSQFENGKETAELGKVLKALEFRV